MVRGPVLRARDVSEVTVDQYGLGTDRPYLHIEVAGGPKAGIWELRFEPRASPSGPGSEEPGKWVVMLPDGSVHFVPAEEPSPATLRATLEQLLGEDVASEVARQLPPAWH